MSETPPRGNRPKPGYYETPAASPDGDGTVTAFISIEKALQYVKYGPEHKRHELMTLVPETLVDPDRCFPYHPEEFSGYCYTRAATYAMTNSGERTSAPQGMIFTVFLTKTMKVADWGWEDEDPHEPCRPLLHTERLEAPIWSKDQ